MKRLITAILAVVLLLSCAACGSQENTVSEASAGLFAMDTYLNLTAYGQNAEAALEQAQNRIQELEGLWSVTDEHSEIYADNHSGGTAAGQRWPSAGTPQIWSATPWIWRGRPTERWSLPSTRC